MRLRIADWLPFPFSRVFAFFSNPENVPRHMLAEMQRKVDGFRLIAPPSARQAGAETSCAATDWRLPYHLRAPQRATKEQLILGFSLD
jgi:hypothetical protein